MLCNIRFGDLTAWIFSIIWFGMIIIEELYKLDYLYPKVNESLESSEVRNLEFKTRPLNKI